MSCLQHNCKDCPLPPFPSLSPTANAMVEQIARKFYYVHYDMTPARILLRTGSCLSDIPNERVVCCLKPEPNKEFNLLLVLETVWPMKHFYTYYAAPISFAYPGQDIAILPQKHSRNSVRLCDTYPINYACTKWVDLSKISLVRHHSSCSLIPFLFFPIPFVLCHFARKLVQNNFFFRASLNELQRKPNYKRFLRRRVYPFWF